MGKKKKRKNTRKYDDQDIPSHTAANCNHGTARYEKHKQEKRRKIKERWKEKNTSNNIVAILQNRVYNREDGDGIL